LVCNNHLVSIQYINIMFVFTTRIQGQATSRHRLHRHPHPTPSQFFPVYWQRHAHQEFSDWVLTGYRETCTSSCWQPLMLLPTMLPQDCQGESLLRALLQYGNSSIAMMQFENTQSSCSTLEVANVAWRATSARPWTGLQGQHPMAGISQPGIRMYSMP